MTLVRTFRNGAVVLNAAPFYPPHNVRFRRETTHILDEPGIQQSTSTAVRHAHQLHPEMPVYERCSSSEINLLCKDFHLAGYDRSIVVPRVRVAYDWKMYAHMRRAFENPREGAPVTVLPRTTMEEYDAREDEPLEWRPYPETVECKPLDRRASRGPTGAWGYEVYTRPGDVEAMYAPSAII